MTVRLMFDSRTVDVDLTPDEITVLTGLLTPYLDAGREVLQVPARKPGKRRGDASAVREWAKTNGFKVGDRGRIPPEVWEAYENRK